MLLLVVAVLIGLVAGRLRHPLGARAPRLRFTWLPLLGAGAALNLAAYLLEGDPATLAMVASLVLLLGFVGVNPHVTGVAVIGVGLFLNLVSVVLNDGMPVRSGALVAAGVVSEAELDTITFSGPRHLESSADTLPVLGDVLPVPLAPAPEVLSFGDLIIVFGAADAVRELARRRRPAWSTADRAAYRVSEGVDGTPGAPSPHVDLRPPFARPSAPEAAVPPRRSRSLVTTPSGR